MKSRCRLAALPLTLLNDACWEKGHGPRGDITGIQVKRDMSIMQEGKERMGTGKQRSKVKVNQVFAFSPCELTFAPGCHIDFFFSLISNLSILFITLCYFKYTLS